MFIRTYLYLLIALLLFRAMPAPAQPLPDCRTLHGVVTSADGRPIGGADITLRRQDEGAIAQFWGAYAVSDARGAFTVPDMEEGAYYVDVTADGYAPVNSLNLNLEPTSQSLQIKLIHLVPLILRVLQPDGTPLVNTEVMLRISGGEGVGTRFPRPTTDQKGQIKFELANNDMPNCPLCQLVPSHYNINIIVPGVGFVALKDLAVQSLTKPGTVDVRLQVGGAVRVTAREAGANGRLLGGALLSLTPVVPDEDTTQRQGIEKIPEDIARLYTLQRDPTGALLVTRDGDGTVELGDLPPGSYRARLFAPGQDIPEPQDVTIKAGEIAQVNFNFKPLDTAGTVEVTAQDSKGQAMAGLDFMAQLQPIAHAGEAADATTTFTVPPLPPGAFESALSLFSGGFIRRAHSDANGHFTLYPLKPGIYRMRVSVMYGPTQIRAMQDRGARLLPPLAQDITIPATGGMTVVTLKFKGEDTVFTGAIPAQRVTAKK